MMVVGILRNVTGGVMDVGYIVVGETAEKVERIALLSLVMTFERVGTISEATKDPDVQATWIDPTGKVWELVLPEVIDRPDHL